jgi:hypothetical protein
MADKHESITKVLTDCSKNIDVRNWSLSSAEVPQEGTLPPWKIVKRTLEGGQQEGVEIIEVDSGAMQFTVVPTRGLSIWNGQAGNITLGWDSPVKKIIHPRFIDLSRRNGLGWLDGFGGWIVRCGLASVGPPCLDGDKALTLHGRIDYLPASYVEVRYEASPIPRIFVRGTIEEGHLRLTSEISIAIGSSAILLDDLVGNIGDATQEMQMLYHINFGPPLLGEGACMVAPIQQIVPRDQRAAEEAGKDWLTFHGPQGPTYTEQVYLMELQSDPCGNTAAMLRAPDRASAALLTFNVRELPHFILWKNEVPTDAGYVTGLEPATSYPFPRPFEREDGRVPTVQPGESRRMCLRIDILSSPESVRIEADRIQARITVSPIVLPTPFANG